MDRYGLLINFTDSNPAGTPAYNIEDAITDWVSDKLRQHAVTGAVESVNVVKLDDDELEVKAATPRLLASTGHRGGNLTWEIDDQPKRTYPKWECRAQVKVNTAIDNAFARQLVEEAKGKVKANNMTEPEVAIFRLT